MCATVRGLLMELGPAEMLDTGVIGPLAMGTASPHRHSSGQVGVGYDVLWSAILVCEIRTQRARKHVTGRISSSRAGEDRKEFGDVIDALANSEVFGIVAHEDLEFLATLFQRRDFEDAEPICQWGDEAREFYIIKDGQVEITMHPDGPVVATLSRSAVIGEYAMFIGSKRTATMIAKALLRCSGWTMRSSGASWWRSPK
jgi:hypothetical protein